MIVSRNRSVLFVPATNQRAMAKMPTLAADMVIIDLEDAVAPDRKDAARKIAVEALCEPGWSGCRRAVRINPKDTEWHQADLQATAPLAVDAIVLPKVCGAGDLLETRRAIGSDRPPFFAMIETCAGVMKLPSIIEVAEETGLIGLIAGLNDLSFDMRCRMDPDRTALRPMLTQIIMAARSKGLIVLDGVYNQLDDNDGLLRECSDGAMLGFDGKTLIHPSQIDVTNTTFAPTPSEIDWARRIVAAFEGSGASSLGAIRLDGQMVERLHLAQAEAILAGVP